MNPSHYPFPRLSSTRAMPSMDQLREMTRNLTERAQQIEQESAERIERMRCGRCGFQAKYQNRRIQICPCMQVQLRQLAETQPHGPPMGMINPLESFCGIQIEVVDPNTQPRKDH